MGTLYPADSEPEEAERELHRALIAAMYRETGRVAAGTGQLMNLEAKNNRIIKRLGDRIAIPDKNGYHSIVNGHR